MENKIEEQDEEFSLPFSFWKKYIKADFLGKQEMIKNFPIINGILVLVKDKEMSDQEKEKIISHYLTIILTSYFDDFEEALNYLNSKKKD
jgi:hypothetical protein